MASQGHLSNQVQEEATSVPHSLYTQGVQAFPRTDGAPTVQTPYPQEMVQWNKFMNYGTAI